MIFANFRGCCGMSRGGGSILRHRSCGRSRLLYTQMGVVTEEGGVGKKRAVTSETLFFILFVSVSWMFIGCIFCVLFLIVLFSY